MVDKIRRLMPTDQLHSVNPLRLAKKGELIEGCIPIDNMDRLNGLILDKSGMLNYRLFFNIDQSGQYYIESEISVSVRLECQRCLESFSRELNKSSKLGIVRNKEESDFLTKDYEPIFLEEDTVDIFNLMEDEMLLAIPLSPLHEKSDCPAQAELNRINSESKLKPFSDLSKLLKSKD